MAGPADNVIFRTMQTQSDADAFRTLNEEWITRLFRLEEQDRLTLGDPVGAIVARGGQVYLAEDGSRIVGCVALASLGDHTFELAKMAVSPGEQGRGIGRRLLVYVLQQARQMGARTLVLGSSTTLHNAVHLYEALGFRHVPAAELPIRYERASVWMKLDLA